jgi:hypothetical protein
VRARAETSQAAPTGGEARADRPGIARTVAVVALVAVALVGGALAMQAYRERAAEGRFCTAAGAMGPLGDSPEEAFAAWWADVDATQLPRRFGTDPNDLPPVPTADDFVRDGRNFRWYASDDVWYQIDIDHPMEAGEVTSDRWQVIGANRCERFTSGDP